VGRRKKKCLYIYCRIHLFTLIISNPQRDKFTNLQKLEFLELHHKKFQIWYKSVSHDNEKSNVILRLWARYLTIIIAFLHYNHYEFILLKWQFAFIIAMSCCRTLQNTVLFYLFLSFKPRFWLSDWRDEGTSALRVRNARVQF
jgi:hypothetical protein